MAEMKDAINALGEFQELKSQVSSTQDIQTIYNSFSIHFILLLLRNVYLYLIRKN